MKKFIAIMIAASVIFTLASCTSKSNDTSTTTEETGAPGSWVTNQNHEYQTYTDTFIVTDKEGKPVTEKITDEDGSTHIEVVTTEYFNIETYPAPEGETLPPRTTQPTMPAGNTIFSRHEKWPEYDILTDIPKAKKEVDRIDYKKDDNGEIVNLYINEFSYDNFLKYVDNLIKAGYKRSEDAVMKTLPEKATEGEMYSFISRENGKTISMVYYTDSYIYHSYDLLISISDYDVLESLSGSSTTTAVDN